MESRVCLCVCAFCVCHSFHLHVRVRLLLKVLIGGCVDVCELKCDLGVFCMHPFLSPSSISYSPPVLSDSFSISRVHHRDVTQTSTGNWMVVCLFFRLVSQWLLQDFYSHRSTGQGDSKVRINKNIAEMLQLALIPKHTFCYLFPKITESTIQLQFYCTIYILSIQSSFGDNEVTFLVW